MEGILSHGIKISNCFIFGHPEALIGKKIRKVLDSFEIRKKIKAAVVDKAHLIAEW